MITVIIPTYCHPNYIEYLIDNSIKPYLGSFFIFEIHDSSSDDKTKDIIDSFNKSNDRKIIYKKYPSTTDGDIKTYNAISMVRTKYIYLMGDGIAHDFNYLEKIVKDVISDIDFLGILPLSFRYSDTIMKDCPESDIPYSIDDLQYFASNYFYILTLYGGSIISKNIFQYVIDNNLYERFRYDNRQAYSYICSLFSALSTGQYNHKIMFLSEFKTNPLKKQGTWLSGELFCKIFFEEFYNDVRKLPNYYEETKDCIIKNQRIFGFSKGSIVFYRLSGGLKLKYIIRYKNYIKKPKHNYGFMLLVCIVPLPLFKLAKRIRQVFKTKRSN